MLSHGNWTGAWQPWQEEDSAGRFVRKPSSVRNWITQDASPGPTGCGGFKAEEGRYLLYVARICPWAHRTLIARRLKGLEELIEVAVVAPVMAEEGWAFSDYPGSTGDPLYGAAYLHQLYSRHDPDYSGRATVPVLWDRQTGQMVNNESADILRIFNRAFERVAPISIDLYPPSLQNQIAPWNEEIYNGLNNGVYRAGFARSQKAYAEAVADVFRTLDRVEEHLADGRPFFHGAALTETDIRLYVSLVRFDIAYYGLFKCNLRHINDYAHLNAYLKRLYQLPAFGETTDFDHIKAGYYSIRALNPSGIQPQGPLLSFD